ncbi:MAG: 3-phosphoshikimate 1-carboxyvinyltransferase [Saprospiraceae bacterium]|nr:3-phosphoshikimate 1-carboxyvinyltransferase [Saprospiraceae bacterium]
MSNIRLSKKDKDAFGTITLSGSKSISNRVLIIQALCKEQFEIFNLSDSDDTKTLQSLLASDDYQLDAHHAGTTFRFLTSYLAVKDGDNILTGSSRMQERPIQALSEALIQMGADISYVNKEGYPPLRIGPPAKQIASKITLSADISSQYISSLLLVAPTLTNGLEIELIGDIVSRPYLEMTLKIMEYFGIKHSWHGQTIYVDAQEYQGRDFYVEADWSAASYYYIIAAFSENVDLTLKGLLKESLQGDSAIAEIASFFGVATEFGNKEIRLKKSEEKPQDFFEYDFIKCPDIAQSVSTMCAGLGTTGLFSGLQTLRIKETDRIAALQNELAKLNVYLSKLPAKFSKKSESEYFMQEGNLEYPSHPPSFPTYKDHRMAMSFGPFAALFPIEIEDYLVVSKSYPNFWKDLEKVGFIVDSIDKK